MGDAQSVSVSLCVRACCTAALEFACAAAPSGFCVSSAFCILKPIKIDDHHVLAAVLTLCEIDKLQAVCGNKYACDNDMFS